MLLKLHVHRYRREKRQIQLRNKISSAVRINILHNVKYLELAIDLPTDNSKDHLEQTLNVDINECFLS